MKGDFSRQTFDPKKHYSGVLMQQGRVQIDADWNEQQAIQQYRVEAGTSDVIGAGGTPMNDPVFQNNGFKITTDQEKKALFIRRGRYYVNGILCQNEADVPFNSQPYLPDSPDVIQQITKHKKKTLMALLYLDAWQRHITMADDPEISDIALGGADTTTRIQTVWQVKALPIAPAEYVQEYIGEFEREKQSKKGGSGGSDKLNTINDYYSKVTSNDPFPEWKELIEPCDGTLRVRVQPPVDTEKYLVPPASGYTGLENQLYRVEIHHPGDKQNVPTFKWSRENGAVVTPIKKIKDNVVTVENLGADDILGFAPKQWVEVVDDATELQGEPGQLLQISSIDPIARTITLTATPTAQMQWKPKLRRWDQSGTSATEKGVKATNHWFDVEDGIQVQFSIGTYKTGDYWLIPARTLNGQVEWPGEGDGPNIEPAAVKAHGIEHHYSRLALVRLDPTNNTIAMHEDSRRVFTPLASPAMRITWTSWSNDDVVELPSFIDNGLRIRFDAIPDTRSLKPATMIVNLEVLVLVGLDEGLLPHSNSILAGAITVERNAENYIHWQWLHKEEKERKILGWLSGLLQKAHTLVRVRVTLKGHAIWSPQEYGPLYLDGQAFGFPVKRSDQEQKRFEALEEHRKQLIGQTRTHLALPSGAGARASDFESWFYLS